MITSIVKYNKDSGGFIFAYYTPSRLIYKHGGRVHNFSKMIINQDYLIPFKLEFIY